MRLPAVIKRKHVMLSYVTCEFKIIPMLSCLFYRNNNDNKTPKNFGVT